MSTIKNLIDEICEENDYLLTFQVHDLTKNLVRCLIDLRDEKTTSVKDLLSSLEALKKLLKEQTNELKSTDPHYESNLSYLNEIEAGICCSFDRVLAFQLNETNTND